MVTSTNNGKQNRRKKNIYEKITDRNRFPTGYLYQTESNLCRTAIAILAD